MFDIGFWEIAVIGVVALIVVGPEEFPAMVRNATRGIAKLRNMIGDVKSDLSHEIDKVEELKRLIEEETKISEMQDVMNDINGTSVSVPSQSSTQAVATKVNEKTSSSGSPETTTK
ncbi:Twin-arginine translocation protein TatB [hydrothermal vent metagenome]|uniref:Twin-arginine translocation protein TatB n=1 Tax=hydrothermal vent metagenome TaxID=652676 RepID=A0A3B0ZB94_9ZZZZ